MSVCVRGGVCYKRHKWNKHNNVCELCGKEKNAGSHPNSHHDLLGLADPLHGELVPLPAEPT